MSKAEPEALDDVDPLLAEYASALREQETPSREQASATWAAIEAETQSRSRLWLPIVVAVAAILVGALLVGPFSPLQRTKSEPATEAPYRSGDDPTEGRAKPSEPARATALRPTAPPAELERVQRDLLAPAPKPKRPKSQPAPVQPSSLAQETKLLRKIQQAGGAKQHSRVLELTAEHAKRFRNGTFAAERSLARVRALCSVGRRADARSARDRFIEKHPRSHLVPQFEAVCRD